MRLWNWSEKLSSAAGLSVTIMLGPGDIIIVTGNFNVENRKPNYQEINVVVNIS